MTALPDERNRPEPDVVVITAPDIPDRTYFEADEVRLAIEVVSPESPLTSAVGRFGGRFPSRSSSTWTASSRAAPDRRK
jgi:hypothetical protein